MGIHYAHLAGNDDGTPLVHGDLRPETVMVSFDGVCKVAGYGALSVAPRERNGRRVRNRRNYSAPEQIVGGRDALTPRTDVFLLGLLLHECLSGRMPFHDAPDADQAVLTRPLPPLPGDVPRALTEVITRATSKRANDRYESALDFRDAVVEAVDGVVPPSRVFADFLTQLFPPERDARATRHQMLEMGLSEVSRRASLTGVPAVPSGIPLVPVWRPSNPALPSVAAATPGPSASTPEPTEGIDVDVDVSMDVPFEDDDANAVDSVLEITGRHARPGVAKPLPREEPPAPAPAPLSAAPAPSRPAVAEAEAAAEAVAPRKRRARMSLVAGLITVTAAAASVLIWSNREAAAPPAPAPVAVAQPTAKPPAAKPAPTPEPAAKPPPAPEPALAAVAEDAGTALAAAAMASDSGTAPTQGAVAAVAVVPEGAAPTGAVQLVSGTLPATPPPAAAVATRLKLFVLPPVQVSLAGKTLGKTPLNVPLAPGPYTLEMSDPAKGLRTTREVTVGPEQVTTQRMLLGRGTVRITAEEGRLWALFGMTQPVMRGELEAYGDNEFVERDEYGQREGMRVSFQRTPDGGLVLLFDGQPVGQRVDTP